MFKNPVVPSFAPGIFPHNIVTKFRAVINDKLFSVFGASIVGDKLKKNDISGSYFN